MPRFRRLVRPGSLVHIIVRFVNHEFLLAGPAERGEYLRRAGKAFRETDWVALSYALMSTHTHFAAIAGHDPFSCWSRPLHVGFVGWLNPRTGRLGAGVANRPSTEEVPFERCGRLIAYHHNNPVRAGVVSSASGSDWTSHSAYQLADGPDWLDVELGLKLSGFSSSRAGRNAFAAFVDDSGTDVWPVNDELLRETRREARRQLGTVVELAYPLVSDPPVVPIVSPSSAALVPRWGGSLDQIAAEVCRTNGIGVAALTGRSRLHSLVAARRTFLLVALRAGRSLTEAAAYVGVSVQAASKAVRRVRPDARAAAHSIANRLEIPSEAS